MLILAQYLAGSICQEYHATFRYYYIPLNIRRNYENYIS